MTSAQQTQYYSFLEQQRKRAIYNQSLTYYYIAAIKQHIAAGGDPALDPDLSAQYFLLLDEFGENFFSFEDENGIYKYIQTENQDDVK